MSSRIGPEHQAGSAASDEQTALERGAKENTVGRFVIAMVIGGVSFFIAAASVFLVKDKDDIKFKS